MWVLCAILFECVVENVQENKEKQPMLSAGTLQPRAWYPAVTEMIIGGLKNDFKGKENSNY